MKPKKFNDAFASTIAAIATPSGRGGIGIIRISGIKTAQIAEQVLGQLPKEKVASYLSFLDRTHQVIDQGIALFFKAPYSFTGEDVLELQAHGGPIVLDMLLKRVLELGAELAKPGEFSERAFLNGKIDLTQAEAIADLIDAQSTQAARSALRSLQGDFSQQINNLIEPLTHLRMYVEAAIDFPEEEIDFLSDGVVANDLQYIINQLNQIQTSAKQGALLRDGMTVVIAGKPNAGKSSLLNCLCGQDTAIVTEIPGTTRDLLREHIDIDGLPLHIIDTAGLCESHDPVEQEGIRRAQQEIKKADCVLLVVDINKQSSTDIDELWQENFAKPSHFTIIYNKIDILNLAAKIEQLNHHKAIYLCAKTGEGVSLLREHLKSSMGFLTATEGSIIARRRHIEALEKAHQHILNGQKQLAEYHAGELLAEELRLAQEALGEITGKVHADELLGKIFSSFCIGK